MSKFDKKPIDTNDLRTAFGKFPTGVTVVTTLESNNTPRGFTANSFTSVSLDPPLLLVCVDKRAASLPVFLEGRGFAINVLALEQKEISGLFATQKPDKFEIVPWHNGSRGLPLIDDAIGWFECRLESHVDAGDHVIFIGEIEDYGYRNGKPLGYVSGGYFSLGIEQSIVDAASKTSSVRICALLQQDGTILLEEDSQSNELSVPSISEVNGQPNLAKLIAKLAGENLSLSIDFLFAVYEDQKTGVNVVCYRGEATGLAPQGMRFYAFEEIPWGQVVDEATDSMLRRYTEEFKYGDFAIYMGDDVEGKVRTLESKPLKAE